MEKRTIAAAIFFSIVGVFLIFGALFMHPFFMSFLLGDRGTEYSGGLDRYRGRSAT